MVDFGNWFRIYTKELHDLHNDYPLGLEKVKISEDMSSEYFQNIRLSTI